MEVNRVVAPAAPQSTAKSQAGASVSGFGVLLDPSPPPAAAIPASAATPMPPYPETASPDIADRAARRHGRAMLQALGDLQRAMLQGTPMEAQVALARLATNPPPPAHDPVLRLILREIAVRAAVELARPAINANVSVA